MPHPTSPPSTAELCERAVILSEGRIVADGVCASILADEHLLARHDLELPAGFDAASLVSSGRGRRAHQRLRLAPAEA